MAPFIFLVVGGEGGLTELWQRWEARKEIGKEDREPARGSSKYAGTQAVRHAARKAAREASRDAASQVEQEELLGLTEGKTEEVVTQRAIFI